MGMSMSVKVFKPANEKWRKMKAIWDSCQQAGIETPPEVDKYFNGESPDEAGVKAGYFSDMDNKFPDWLKRYSVDMQDGFEIDTTKLPKDVSVVRFVCSY